MIYVEYDGVARKVYKFNHDPSFNPNLPGDGVDYVYINSFDDLDQDIESFMNKYGRK